MHSTNQKTFSMWKECWDELNFSQVQCKGVLMCLAGPKPAATGQPTSVLALPRLAAVDRSAVTQPKVGHVFPAAELQRSPL